MKNIMMGLMMLGIIHQINESFVIAEVSDENGETSQVTIPVSLLPCTPRQGEYFHFVYAPNVTEIRCGEPEPG